jgi:hypothetical protein
METELPENLVVNCPKHDFKQSRAKNCFECDFFKGLKDNGVGELPFVVCNKPLTRRLTAIL